MKLNIGAGQFQHDDWTNVDHASAWYGDRLAPHVEWDATSGEPLPFADGSAECVYTSHLIEHLERRHVAAMFSEAYRVLAPDGVLRVTAPDAELLHHAATFADPKWWAWQDAWFQHAGVRPEDATVLDRLVREIATPRCRWVAKTDWSEPIARLFHELERDTFLDALCGGLVYDPGHPGDHITWWGERRVAEAMVEAGFGCVYSSRRGQSMRIDMRTVDMTLGWASLYVEAINV